MLNVLYGLLLLLAVALLGISLEQLIAHRAERWLLVIAQQLPKRREIRAQEWLAQLDELPTSWAIFSFLIACSVATFRAQESQLRAGVRLILATLKWLLLCPLRVILFFRPREEDLKGAVPWQGP